MAAHLVLALGLMLCIEGLIFALAPNRIEDLLDALRQIPVEGRRLVGLLALAAGVGLAALARGMGL